MQPTYTFQTAACSAGHRRVISVTATRPSHRRRNITLAAGMTSNSAPEGESKERLSHCVTVGSKRTTAGWLDWRQQGQPGSSTGVAPPFPAGLVDGRVDTSWQKHCKWLYSTSTLMSEKNLLVNQYVFTAPSDQTLRDMAPQTQQPSGRAEPCTSVCHLQAAARPARLTP